MKGILIPFEVNDTCEDITCTKVCQGKINNV